jgi:dehydrogenase E1 component
MVATRAYFQPYDDTNTKHKDRMSDPGTTYRTREEVQRMRSTQDPIRGLQHYIEEWGVASDTELKASGDCLSLVVCGGLNVSFRLSIRLQRG